ncbi:hypothetical protein JOQ06_006413, partial [Pogonophryne albipinna]
MEDKKMEIWRGAFRGEERNDDQSKRGMEARGVGGTQGREQTKRGNSPWRQRDGKREEAQ